jgi:chromate reductase
VGQEAVAASKGQVTDPNEDVWRIDDIEIVLQNLVTASGMQRTSWIAWPYTKLKIGNDQWPESGDLDLGSQVFLS